MLLRSGGSGGGGPALPELHRRLKWVALGAVAAFLLLAGRLWQLQVMRGESYYERTVSNVVKERYLPSVRGKILDKKGVPLADNRPAFNIYAIPKQVDDKTKAELSRLLALSEDERTKIDERLELGKKRDPKKPIAILEDQGRDRAAIVEQAQLAGVEVHHEPYRYYPQGDMAAHLVGYMSQMTEDEADRLLTQGYDTSELVGRYGLEAAWENYLRGKKGIERYAVDARGQRLDDKTAATLIQGERVTGAVPGANLVLTIDADLQKLIEKVITQSRVPAAAVVVVEPKTGKLRAVVSRPSFDPNVMTGHLTRQEDAMLRSDPRKPFIDKALRGTYAPGSVFKFVTTLAALEDGQAAEDESIFCTGEYQLSGTTFRCNGTHGKQDLVGAIQHSCNIYFWKLAERIGLDRIAETARQFGFGTPTNLGLNGDAGGRIPTKAWYEKQGRYKIGYATNAATGQGDVEVTVVQMAMAYAALANGGKLWVPQVVERVESSDGRPIASYPPKLARELKLPEDALDIWRRGMWKVTNAPGGTAFDHGYVSLVPVMGKTGTAEIRTKRHKEEDERDLENWNPARSHAWFAGWAPADDPEIAIVVFVEHGGSGGRVAWPIAKQVLETYFTKLSPNKITPPPPPKQPADAAKPAVKP
ncbi:MAG TPA: penicillin-binding protein 2 [Kofleriaceae bacterium]|nr:penicillin-binding protein 2 [Kofleriaceae bacterium]